MDKPPKWMGSRAQHKAYIAYLRKFPKAVLSASQKAELEQADRAKKRRR